MQSLFNETDLECPNLGISNATTFSHGNDTEYLEYESNGNLLDIYNKLSKLRVSPCTVR